MAFLIALLALALTQSASAPHPQAPDELSKLAFFVGAWELDSRTLQPDGGYTSEKARSYDGGERWIEKMSLIEARRIR